MEARLAELNEERAEFTDRLEHLRQQLPKGEEKLGQLRERKKELARMTAYPPNDYEAKRQRERQEREKREVTREIERLSGKLKADRAEAARLENRYREIERQSAELNMLALTTWPKAADYKGED